MSGSPLSSATAKPWPTADRSFCNSTSVVTRIVKALSGFAKTATGDGAIAARGAASKPGRCGIDKPTGAIKTVPKAGGNIVRASGGTSNGSGWQ